MKESETAEEVVWRMRAGEKEREKEREKEEERRAGKRGREKSGKKRKREEREKEEERRAGKRGREKRERMYKRRKKRTLVSQSFRAAGFDDCLRFTTALSCTKRTCLLAYVLREKIDFFISNNLISSIV